MSLGYVVFNYGWVKIAFYCKIANKMSVLSHVINRIKHSCSDMIKIIKLVAVPGKASHRIQ